MSHAWYALRRTLPPWTFEENLAELIECLPRYGVDELIVKIDTEEFSHGQPPLKWVKRYAQNLHRIKAAMDQLGVRFSINPWITMGHNDRGRDSRPELPGLQTMVGHDGTRSAVCACPLCGVWREHVRKVWTIYAETHPHAIWIEDDIRTFNHLPVSIGCFCPLHLQRFSERVGRAVSREDLVAAILKPGKPHRWRSVFLDMQGEVMAETVAFLARTVHAASPETCLGLMSSGPAAHCLDGRRWGPFAEALADGRPLYSRPPMGNYHETSLRGFYYSHDSIKITRACLPPGTVEQTEVENVPFTQYAKSAAFTFLEMAISFAYGSHGVTMNLYDHCGTPMEDEPAFGRMLADRKPFLNGLARLAQQPGAYRGVRLLHDERAANTKRLPEHAPYHALIPQASSTMQMLETHGIPTTYDESEVTATSGQMLRALSDAETTQLLSRGLMLDAIAAGVLVERGFGAHIGVRSMEPPVHLDRLGAFSAEEFLNPDFGGADGKYLTLTIPTLGGRPNVSVIRPARAAQVISRIVDPDARRHHVCMFAFENRLGGRVVVSALDLASAYGVPFNHTHRAEQLQGVTRWLFRERTPLIVHGGVYPLALRKDIGERTLLGLFNLTLDPWPYVEFELADVRRPARMRKLTRGGRLQETPALRIRKSRGTWRVRYESPVPFDEPLFLEITWASRGRRRKQ